MATIGTTIPVPLPGYGTRFYEYDLSNIDDLFGQKLEIDVISY